MNENLKVELKDLLEGEVILDFVEDAIQSEIFSKEDDIKFLEKISGHIKFKKAGSMILTDGNLKTSVKLTCVLCLNEFDYDIDVPFGIIYSAKPKKVDMEIELTKEDLDIAYFSDEFINPSEEIRDAIILDIPFNPRCKGDCLGLCPRCGMNLNIESCGCEKDNGDEDAEAWKSKLKKLKTKIRKD